MTSGFQPNKIIAGIFAFAPLLVFIALFIPLFALLADLEDLNRRIPYGEDPELPDAFYSFIIILPLAILISLASMVYYLVIIVKNDRLSSDMRTAWILITIFGGLLAHLVYFFVHIVKQDDPRPASPNHQTFRP